MGKKKLGRIFKNVAVTVAVAAAAVREIARPSHTEELNAQRQTYSLTLLQ